MNMDSDGNAAERLLLNQASGTSMNPESWQMPMLMRTVDQWKLMFMASGFLIETQQSGPRGGDKLYSPNWGMFAAEHPAGGGAFLFQTMLSLDPATVTKRRYPALFQTGETAFGRPIVDGQHPHDFIMALGVQYAHSLGENTTVQLYYAPVGDPAFGPVAFPHRASAAEIPQATLGHHWQDSTHIANQVVTVALKRGIFRLEASGFYGTEPNEGRWNIDYGPINSWATRLSLFPTKNWMAEVSLGRLAHPERQEPGDDVRVIASLHYTRMVAGGDWSSSAIWGRKHQTATGRNTSSFLVESVYPLSKKNVVTGRAELVDKDELFAAQPELVEEVARTAGSTFRIGAYTAGYTRELGVADHVSTGIGANVTGYTTPGALKPSYGEHPWGVSVYLRLRLLGE